jgi:hypothetical protein
MFGVSALVFGVLGIPLIFGVATSSVRTTALIETVVFSLAGVLALWAEFKGAAAVTSGLTILGWVLLIGGALLALMAFLRRDSWQGDQVLTVRCAGKGLDAQRLLD